MADIKESLGITNFGPWYIEILPGQNMSEEYLNIAKFIKIWISAPQRLVRTTHITRNIIY